MHPALHAAAAGMRGAACDRGSRGWQRRWQDIRGPGFSHHFGPHAGNPVGTLELQAGRHVEHVKLDGVQHAQ